MSDLIFLPSFLLSLSLPHTPAPTNHTAAVSEEGPKVAKFLDR